MQPFFDFDRLCRLAQEDPQAFEAQRQALFEAAFAEIPPARQGGARLALAEVQLRMLRARHPGERLAVSFEALGESVASLQHGFATLVWAAGIEGGAAAPDPDTPK